MPRTLAVLLLLILVLNLGGCYDKRDIERRTAILALGIDKNPEDDQGLEVTAQIAVYHNMGETIGGSEGGGTGAPLQVATVRGPSIGTALEKLEGMVNNPIFLGHTMLLTISQEAASQGIYPLLDYFLRSNDFRRKSWLIITPGRAKELLELTSPLHPLPPLYVLTTLESLANNKAIPIIRFEDFIFRFNSPSKQAVAVMLKPAGDKVELQGLAAFAGERMVGRLSPAELRLFLYLSQAKGRGLINLLEPGKGQIKYSFEVHNSNRRIKSKIQDGEVSLAIDLWLEGNIVENPGQADLNDESRIKELEQRLSAQLERDCQRVIRKIQGQLRTDVLNLGEYVRAYHPHYWKDMDWQGEFPTVPITVQATAHIRRLGLRRK